MTVILIDAEGKDHEQIKEEVLKGTTAACVIHNIGLEAIQSLEHYLIENSDRKIHTQFSNDEPKDADVFLVDKNHEINFNGQQISQHKKAQKSNAYDFKFIIESSLNEVYIFNAEDYHFEFVNKGGLDNLGYSLEEMQEMTPMDIAPEINAKKFKELVEPLLTGKKQKLVFESVHQRADKSQYPIEVHTQMMQQGDHKFFTAIVVDKTESEALNKESSEQLKQMSAMAQNIPKGSISLIDKDLNILFTDGDGYRTHGIDPKTLTGISAKEILDGSVFELLKKASQKFSDSDAVVYNVKFENNVYQNTLKAVFDNNKQFKYFILTVFDITELSNKTKALEVEKNKYASIYKALNKSALVSITDVQGIIIDVNEEFCRTSKYGENELIGQSHDIINSEHHPKAFWDDMWKQVQSGKSWRAEVKNKAKDGSFYWVDTVINPIKDVNGEITSFLSIRYLITEQKKLEQSKEELTNRLELATRAAKMGVWSYDVETKVIFWDEKMLEIFRIKSFDGQFESFANLIHENDREQVLESLSSYLEDENIIEYDHNYRVNTLNDEEVYIRGKAIIERKDGVAKKITGVAWERTEEKKAELQLQEQNDKLAQLESFINQGRDAIQVSDESGRLVYVNDAAAERLAIAKEHVASYHVSDFEPLFRDNLAWKNHIKDLKAKGHITVHSENLNQKTKEGFPVEVEVTLQNINGQNYVIANSRDIKDRKKAEAKLKASEEQFALALKGSNDGYFDADLNTGKTFYSDRYFEMLGITGLENIQNKDFWKSLLYEADKERVLKEVGDALSSDLPFYEVEERLHHSNGNIIPTLVRAFVTRNDAGEPIRISGTLMDLSNLKKAQEELKASEEKFRFIAENTSDGIMVSEGGIITYSSHAYNTILGFSEEETKKKDRDSIYEMLHPDDRDQIFKLLDESTKNKESSITYQFRVKHKKGHYIWREDTANYFYNEKGEMVKYILVARDITARKEGEIALKESKEMLSDVANNLPGLILSYVVYPDGTDQILFLSEGCIDLWEISKEDALADTNKVWAKVHRDDLDQYYKSIEKSAAELSPWKFEWRLVMDDGRIKWISGIGQPKELDDGSVLWHTLHLDITDQKNAELELEKTLEHLNLSIETGKMGIWELNFKNGSLDWNDQMFGIFGVEKSSFDHGVETFRKRVHPEDIEYMDGVLGKLSTTNILDDTQFRIVKPDGQIRHILVSGRASSCNESGEIEKYIGVNIDVTHIAEYQEQLKSTVAEKDALFKELHHRIKNNLQMVSSLLFIKSTMTEDLPLKRFIDETSTKIHSISSIHEQLLQMQGVDQLDVREYLNSLCQNLVSTYSYGSSKFDLKIELESAIMDIDRVLNIGLIVNEIISNTMKYAYPESDNGKIHVSLKHKNNKSVLLVSDQGIGIPDEKISKLGNSYGMQLISIFTKQIKGILDIKNSNGTKFIIKFPTNV